MKAKKEISEDLAVGPADPAMLQLARLYLSTSEKLAEYAYAATALQQQMNMLAQQVTVRSIEALYEGGALP